jgi:hypothetical protein
MKKGLHLAVGNSCIKIRCRKMWKKSPAVFVNNKMEFGFQGISDLFLIYKRKQKKAKPISFSL